MTAAGITSVIITVGQLGQPHASIKNNRIDCCGKTNITNDPIDAALNWLAKNFKVFANPGGQWQLYYLYGLERVGRLTGQRFIGEHDWYREGAAQLLGNKIDSKVFSLQPAASNLRFTSTPHWHTLPFQMVNVKLSSVDSIMALKKIGISIALPSQI